MDVRDLGFGGHIECVVVVFEVTCCLYLKSSEVDMGVRGSISTLEVKV